MAFETATTLKTPTGATLRLYIGRTDRKARGVIQINHGMAEHAGRYARFAAFLGENGFHTYAHDHRGHGHTAAPQAPLGSFGPEPAAENVLADVLAVHDRIAEEHPGLPVVLFGHSMGAMIALAFLARHPARVQAAALWNMPLANRIEAHAAKAVLAWERFRLGSDVPSRILPRLTFQSWARAVPNARTPFDWLSRDVEEVQGYISDPLCGWGATVGMWHGIFDLNLMAVRDRKLAAVPEHLPVQLVGGGSDPSTHNGRTMHRLGKSFAAKRFSNLETRIYPENRHESLNEINRDRVMRDFVTWANKVLG